jgi:hypothetical protein
MAVVITGNNTPTAGGVVYGDGTTYATTTAGTSGRPIVSGGAGAPTFRPYTLPAADGSANQILQTDGAGALSFATPSSGAWVYLSTVTASNSATVDIETTFNSTYENYAIVASSVKPVDSVVQLRARQKQSGSYVTSGYQWHLARSHNQSAAYNGSASYGGESSYVVAIDLSASGDGSQGGVSFVMYIPNPSNTTLQKGVFSTGVTHSAFIDVAQSILAGANAGSTAAVTGIRFLMESGNIASGTFRLYGIANS